MRQQKRVTRHLFYFTKLKAWDTITITAYLFLSLLLWQYSKISEYSEAGDAIFCYGIFTQLFLYFMNYKSLRNASVYFFWVLVGFIHFVVYFYLKDNPALQIANKHPVTILRNTIFLLLLFQILRFISLKFQAMELVAVGRGPIDAFDGRKITIIDSISTIFYSASTIILSLID
ncbi:hypothetical protein CDA63_14720 [Hymenobacter amundsenii]|uniref:Uncharacterized protein n=1 Tax=Hymenobacter amundsenii TaxID=2006685 RepID=A0A246FIH2_9BACT|nr:hypothetical protein [Hymenobacter amundsenii]OWP62336.1 hypothetical protein CDA63_14720 [Hymenobacter amundsenii]